MTDDTMRKLKRSLARAKGRAEKLKKDYVGREGNLTFHAGFDFGYELGKVAAFEMILDAMEELG